MDSSSFIGFDRVTITGEDGRPARSLSRAEYERLPLRERVKLLMDGSVVFYKDGQEIRARDALKG